MGDLWRMFYSTVQDAIALSLLLKIPGIVGFWIIGKQFSDYQVCLQESAWGASRYACFVIVTSDFLLWIVLAGRIFGRFWAEISKFRNHQGGSGSGTNKP